MTCRNKIAVIAGLFAGILLIALFGSIWVERLAGNKAASSSRRVQTPGLAGGLPVSGGKQNGSAAATVSTPTPGILHTNAPAERSEPYHLACEVFDLWVKDYLETSMQRRTEIEARGSQLAQERRRALRKLIRTSVWQHSEILSSAPGLDLPRAVRVGCVFRS